MDGDGLLSKHSVGGRLAGIVDEQEFQEAEVWETVHDDDHHSKSSNFFPSSSAIGAPRHHHGGQPHSSDPLVTPGWSYNTPGLSHKSTSMSGFSNYNGAGRKQQELEADEEDEMIPPHEWIARRFAGSQISSSSVCEGAGRTLKGRDLGSVLAKTGFLEL